KLEIVISETGYLSYSVKYKENNIILHSLLGIVFKEPSLTLRQFEVLSIDTLQHDKTWQPVWGEYENIRDQHKELRLKLADRNQSGIELEIVFRIFNEGLGFRYEFPKQQKLDHFIVADELTEFNLEGDHKAFWIPGDYDSNEFTYNTTKLSEIDA